MQPHARGLGICREAVDGGLFELGSRMKEIDRLCVRRRGALLHAGDERRDADPRTHPDLMWLRILEVETAVRAFHRNRHAELQSFPQAAGVVAQRLGDEDEPTVSGVPGGGDGVRMRAFVFVRGDEGELPGGMAAPAVLQDDGRFEYAQRRVLDQIRDGTRDPAAGPDPPGQRQQRGHGAAQQQGRH